MGGLTRIAAGLCCLACMVCALTACRASDTPTSSSSHTQSDDKAAYSMPSIPTVSDDGLPFVPGEDAPASSDYVFSTPPTISSPAPDSTDSPDDTNTPATGRFDLEQLYPSNNLFSPVEQDKKWFYRNLTDQQKTIYRIIDQAAAAMQTGKIHVGACSYPDLALVYTAVKSDHPEYFWLPAGYIYELVNGQMYIAFEYEKDGYEIHYPYTREERDNMIVQLRQVLEEAAAQLNADMSAYDRALILHDWLNARLTYDQETAAGSSDHAEAFTVASLLDSTAVCEGYARSYQLLLYCAGIENTLVTGQVKDVGHMWNLVKIDGNWYHTDTTWNDSGDQGLHTYFHLTDAAIAADHALDPDYSSLSYDDLAAFKSFNFNLPACRAISASFFALNGTMISGENAFAHIVTNALVQAALDGKRSCEFGFGDTYAIQFTSSQEMLQRIADERCLQMANEQLPASKQLPTSISCNGIVGSKGFALSW